MTNRCGISIPQVFAKSPIDLRLKPGFRGTGAFGIAGPSRNTSPVMTANGQDRGRSLVKLDL